MRRYSRRLGVGAPKRRSAAAQGSFSRMGRCKESSACQKRGTCGECRLNWSSDTHRHSCGRTNRERKAKRDEKVDRKDADEYGPTEPQDRGFAQTAHAQKD